MSETNGAVAEVEEVTLAEPETVEVQSREDKLKEYIASRVTDSTAEDSDDETYQATEVTGETPEDPPPEVEETVEGPSMAMKAAAAGWVHPALVETAVNDEQLSTWVRMAQEQQQQPQQQQDVPASEETPPEPESLLPEDEFPSDDPVRKAIDTIQAKHDEKYNSLVKDMESVIQVMSSLQTDQKAVHENAGRADQKVLDDALDGVGGPFGEFGKLDEFSFDFREKAFSRLQLMKKSTPNVPYEELVEQYLNKTGFKEKEPGPGPIKKAARSKLGGRPSPPAPEPPLSREEKMRRMLRKLQDRR